MTTHSLHLCLVMSDGTASEGKAKICPINKWQQEIYRNLKIQRCMSPRLMLWP